MDNSKHCKAFSLVELSISIAIIALLLAAVFIGQNIKHRLEINQIAEQIDNLKEAVSRFKESYKGTPGDLYNAEIALGQNDIGNKIADNGGDGNGDGDNKLESSLVSPSRDEKLLFWQHLAAAGLITGSYDNATIGEEGMYKSPFKDILYEANTDPDLNNRIYLTLSGITNGKTGYGAFSTKDASDIDTKFDDGLPESGNIRATEGNNITSGECVSKSEYNLSNKNDYRCILNFYLE